MSARYVFTNSSEWLFNNDPLLAASDTYKNNQLLFRKIFSNSDINFTRRLCYDKCVNEFESSEFSLKERACINSCLNSTQSFLFNLNVNLNNIA
jgi:hypothetical protein